MSQSKYAVGCQGTPGQGPFMIVILLFENDRIAEAKFSTYGCPAAIACGTYVCEQIEGRTWAEAVLIDEEAILTGVGGMPLGREHCPGLASSALRKAVDTYRQCS